MSEPIQWTKMVERKQNRRLVVAVSIDDGGFVSYEELTDEDLAKFRGDFLEKHMAMVRDRNAWQERADTAEGAIAEVHAALDPTSSRRKWTPQQRREAIAGMLSALKVSQ